MLDLHELEYEGALTFDEIQECQELLSTKTQRASQDINNVLG